MPLKSMAVISKNMFHTSHLLILFSNLIWTHCEIVNPCDQFPSTSNVPNAHLERCPQAKFMATDDYECYDKEFKNE